MGRVYSINFDGVAVTAAVDFFEIAPADDKPVAIIGIMLSQSSDLGDAAEEILRVNVVRGNTTTGTGGTQGVTPAPVNSFNDAAAGAACDTCNTTGASSGTAVTLFSHAFNIRSGMEHYFPPECRPTTSQAAGFLCVRLAAAPADSLTMSGTLFFEELF